MWNATDWHADFAGEDTVLNTIFFVFAVAVGEGNLVSASEESRQFSVPIRTVCAIKFFTVLLHDSRLISVKFYQHVNLIHIPTRCFLQGFWNHKYIVCVYMCQSEHRFSLMLHVSHDSPYLIKNVRYEWMDGCDWILLNWEAWLTSGMATLMWSRKTQSSHLCVTFLVSWQADWEYFVIRHQAWNAICISRATFCIKYFCQSINQYFTEMCQVYDSELVNVTIENTGSRKRGNGWK